MSGGVPSLAAALLSAVCYATAAVAQERTAASGRKPTGGLWTLALVLQAAGAGLHAVALRYGSLTVVQALGALTLVLALPLHAALGRRRVRAREWRGAGLTVLGLVTLLLSTAPPGTERALSGAELVLLAAITAAAALALTRLPWGADLSVLRALRFATAAGAAFGIASCLTQGLAVHLAAQGLGAAVADPMLLVAAGCTGVLAIAGMMWSQEAYRGGLGVALAAVTLANPWWRGAWACCCSVRASGAARWASRWRWRGRWRPAGAWSCCPGRRPRRAVPTGSPDRGRRRPRSPTRRRIPGARTPRGCSMSAVRSRPGRTPRPRGSHVALYLSCRAAGPVPSVRPHPAAAGGLRADGAGRGRLVVRGVRRAPGGARPGAGRTGPSAPRCGHRPGRFGTGLP